MASNRSRTRHAKRAFAGAFAACVAATAMAYSSGGFQHGHSDEAPGQGAHGSHGGGVGGGDLPIDVQENGQDQGSVELTDNGAPGGGAGGGLTTPPGGSGGSGGGHHHYGPGDNDGSGGSGFMPNGEDGLMTLASFAQGLGGNGDGAGAPGDGGGIGDGGSYFSGGLGDPAGGDGTKDGQNGDGQPGGKGGFGGGGGGGGGGGTGGPSSPGSNPPAGGDGCTPGPLLCNPVDGPTGDPGIDNPGGPTGGQNDPPPGGFNGPFTPNFNGGQTTDGGGPLGGDDPADPPLTPVPEPASWLMLILGFGVLGQALRARQRIAA